MEKEYDVKTVDGWLPPTGDDLRPLIAMPNIPRPLHGLAPRTLLGSTTWDHMRKRCYAQADNTCVICGCKPDNAHHRHSHEAYKIDYAHGTSTFAGVYCLCSLCHLGGIHTGRALTLWKHGNPLYPTEFLLKGAENAFRIIYEYNQDHPGADLRAYATFLDYLKHDELREPMEKLIEKYQIKFYEEVDNMVEWKDWKLIIGSREYDTPYEDEDAWKSAMEERGKADSARILQKNLEGRFSGGVYDQLKEILKNEITGHEPNSKAQSSLANAVIAAAIEESNKKNKNTIDTSAIE